MTNPVGTLTPARPESDLEAQRRAVAALCRDLGAQLIETHISFVLLADGDAYKIKKALDLGFLDFRTLAQRRFDCDEELRLNRRSAPELYLQVLPLTGTPEQPSLAGTGAVIDWVLHMRAFDQAGLWDRLAAAGALRPEHIDAGVEALCALHRDAAVAAPDDPRGQPASVRAPLRDSLHALHDLCTQPLERETLDTLTRWEASVFAAAAGHFEQRLRDGRVRECHGDLHLGNITQHEGRTLLFDCLEFSAALRWTDVMSDLGFLAMDLHSHALPRLAHRCVNAYVERSGDHSGLRVLRYYQVHRALVRAKVAALRAAQLPAAEAQRGPFANALRHYLDVAQSFTRARAPVLMLTHGLSGSGKTLLTQSLLELSGAIRIRADVERKRLFGLGALARSDTAMKARLYGAAATRDTQAQLRERAALALASGFHVILDATFLAQAQRQQAREVAQSMGMRCVLIDFEAGADTLRERVRRRAQRGDDASEADLAVLEDQLARAQPLRADEAADAFRFDAGTPFDAAAMPARWAPLLRRLSIEPA
jgi:aminoglycoside phosphotransferase family enzyme/predicted kinase